MEHPERRLYFEIAATLGCTVEDLLQTMSSEEITEWAAYFKIVAKEREDANK